MTRVFLGLALLMIAQQKPDFSGEWILNREACTLSPAAGAIHGGVARIEHRDPTFHYKSTLTSESGQVQIEFELPSDGNEVVSSQQGMKSASNLRWAGESLLFTSRIQLPNGDLSISFRYELINEGHRLRAVEQLRGSGRDQDNIWIFDRH